MATVDSIVITSQTFENLLNFISKQPNFETIYTHTVFLLKNSLKIPQFPKNSCETTAFYLRLHKENFLKNIFAKTKVMLVWLVSAFVLLTGKTLEDLVNFLLFFFFFIYLIIIAKNNEDWENLTSFLPNTSPINLKFKFFTYLKVKNLRKRWSEERDEFLKAIIR